MVGEPVQLYLYAPELNLFHARHKWESLDIVGWLLSDV